MYIAGSRILDKFLKKRSSLCEAEEDGAEDTALLPHPDGINNQYPFIRYIHVHYKHSASSKLMLEQNFLQCPVSQTGFLVRKRNLFYLLVLLKISFGKKCFRFESVILYGQFFSCLSGAYYGSFN